MNPKHGGVTATTSECYAAFRSKVKIVKDWRPKIVLSRFDKLELYALYKQAVSGDAPLDPIIEPSSLHNLDVCPLERAKLVSWQTKRGISQSQAMAAYIVEADRQILMHGSDRAPSSYLTTTPRNTPKDENERECSQHSSSESTPRGLAAAPLLCAAASESRRAYLQRLGSAAAAAGGGYSANKMSQGWWRRQEPLCGDPGTLFALPETILIAIATALESLSLSVNGIVTSTTSASNAAESSFTTISTTVSNASAAIIPHLPMPSTVLQSLLWPLHNTFLVVWMLIIFLSTLLGSVTMASKTILLGDRETGTTLEDIFAQEIRPSMLAIKQLCARYQAVSVRLCGFALYPLCIISEFADHFRERWSCDNAASGIYVVLITSLWWYWVLVLPVIAFWALLTSIGFGWCFGLIELASIGSLNT